jgi:HEAT repeat protein
MQIATDVLNDEDIRIRASQIISSGKSGLRDAVPSLTAILNNKSEVEWLRACAAIALGRISGDEVFTPLVNALREESIEVSRAAILALSDVKNEKAIPALKDLLEDQEKKELHALTVKILGRIGGNSVVSILIQALESTNNRLRCNAVLALSDLLTKEAVLPLIKILKDSDVCLRAVVASSLGLIGDRRAVGPLIEALNDRDEMVRTIAASSLGYLGDSKAIAPLENILGDTSEKVRKQAAAALSKLRQKPFPQF